AATWLARNALGQGATPAAALATVGAQEYVNVGHTNLNDAVMAAVRPALITVMVHDLIPITHPQYTRAGVTERFAGRMTATATHADRVIANSHATARDVERIFPAFGRTPPVSVAHLGVEASALRHAPAPPGEFICLGTIEPRKNHAVLLDAWQRLSEIGTPPPLLFAGRRGWRNRKVFARLDARPQGVTEDATLSDAALWPRLAAARALLFPSRVEGYGLPALEAAQIGLPVLATDLPVFRELLGPWATYLPPDDPAAWARGVSDIAKIPLGVRGSSRSGIEQPPIPRWHSHFRHVFGED
ncbi:MAG: glycosyltransferase family 1 protein, partial [Pseudomonadota bacterium]